MSQQEANSGAEGAVFDFTALTKIGNDKPVRTKPKIVVRKASEVKSSFVRYIWKNRIPLGAMTLMPGEEGIGKTTMAIRVLSDVTRGEVEGEFKGKPQTVVIMSAEDNVEAVFKPRLVAAGADLERVLFLDYREDDKGNITPLVVPDDLEDIGEIMKAENSPLLYIDSLVTTFREELDTYKYKAVANAIKRINEWAERNNVSVVAPWHLNKGKGNDTAGRMMDSRGFRTASRSILLVVDDPEAPEGVTRGIVALDKVNAGRAKIPGLIYELQTHEYTVTLADGTERAAECGVAVWVDEVDADIAKNYARSRMNAEVGEVKLNECEQWLTDYLIDGSEVELATLLKDADANGFSKSQVYKAKSRKVKVDVRIETGNDDGKPWRKSYWWSVEARKINPGSGNNSEVKPFPAL